MNKERAAQRIATLRAHLQGPDATDAALQPFETAAFSTEYSVTLPEKLTASEPWLVRRNAMSPDKLLETFLPPDDHVHTLYENLENSIAKTPDNPYLGHRPSSTAPYQWMSYKDVGAARSAIDAAIHAYGMTTVPLYDTLGPDVLEYIVNHADVAAVGVAHALLPKLLEALPQCPTLKLIIVYGGGMQARLPDLPLKSKSTCKIVSLDRLRAIGQRNPKPHRPPSPSDVALINYTSGTTGVPKGAVITHGNIIANAAGAAALLRTLFQPGDRHISYLPLAHIYERFNVTVQTHFCGAIGFYRGDVLQLLEDIQELKPNLFASVPRLWNRIYDKVIAQVESGNIVARKLFWTAYNSKKEAIQRGDLSGGRYAALWDTLVFSKVRAKVGGQVRVLSSGASPISPDVFDFLRICFGALVLEGYGMTESACLITLTPPGDPTAGHVGAPIPSCEVKLADIPEMGYSNADTPYPRGEVCVRGPTVFLGYHKDPQNTAETIDLDGWLHTGDVGAWLPGGRLKIIDRKKNIFKLAQGEYIAPEKIENVYMRSPFVMQIFVYGDSLKANLVGVVVPDPEYLLPWAKQRGMSQDLRQLCHDEKVVAAVLKSMQEEGRVVGLKGFEQVAAIHLVPEQFTVDNGLMTPTFKIKRPQALAAFQERIRELYERLPTPGSRPSIGG